MGRAQVGMAALIAILTVPANSFAQGDARLLVRTYNNFGVAPIDLDAARAYAGRVFADAGIQVVWIDCWLLDREAPGALDECRQPLTTKEMTLRLHAGRPGPVDRFVAMGYSIVNIETGAPFLAAVHPDLVRGISSEAGIGFDVLLGRAIAHELGHLLLNSNDHPHRGLMRARWTRQQLRSANPHDWQFGSDEVASIRAAAARRGIAVTPAALHTATPSPASTLVQQ